MPRHEPGPAARLPNNNRKHIPVCLSPLAHTTQDVVVKLVASLTSMRGELTQDVLEPSLVLLRACKQLALEHPLAQGHVDPTFAYAITHPSVDWTHSGRYKEQCLPRLTVTD